METHGFDWNMSFFYKRVAIQAESTHDAFGEYQQNPRRACVKDFEIAEIPNEPIITYPV